MSLKLNGKFLYSIRSNVKDMSWKEKNNGKRENINHYQEIVPKRP